MSLAIQDWKSQIESMTNDPNVSIRYVKLSEINGYGFFASIIPAGEANTGHYHPEKSEKYHIVEGDGLMLSLPSEQLEKNTPPVQQKVGPGMSVDIPGLVVHRLVNIGKEPLLFFFECDMTHMDPVNPVRTIVQDFGGPLSQLINA